VNLAKPNTGISDDYMLTIRGAHQVCFDSECPIMLLLFEPRAPYAKYFAILTIPVKLGEVSRLFRTSSELLMHVRFPICFFLF